MLKKLLLINLLCFTCLCFSQTQNYNIDWSFNSNPDATGAANANRTIEVGDSVTWIWYAGGFHNVVSDVNATESFTSGATQGNGFEYTYTFTQVGTNGYFCNPHSSTMFGTITVVPDGTLSNDQFTLDQNSVKIYPNPVENTLNLNFETSSQQFDLEIFNSLGQSILNTSLDKNSAQVNTSQFQPGIYILKISTGSQAITKRFIKL